MNKKCVFCEYIVETNDTFCPECGHKEFKTLEEPLPIIEEPKNMEKKKVSLKNVYIITSILLSFALVSVCGLYITNKTASKNDTLIIEPNYSKILKDYANLLEKRVSEYVKHNNSIPSIEKVKIDLNFEHKVECLEENINQNGSVYLNKCAIDSHEISDEYGTLFPFEEKKSDIIYSYFIRDEYISYYTASKYNKEEYASTYNIENIELVGTYKCKNNECEFYQYDTKIIVEDSKEIYIADISNKKVSFKKINAKSEHIVDIDNKRYIISLYDYNNTNFFSTVYVSDKVEVIMDYAESGFYEYYKWDSETNKTLLLNYSEKSLKNNILLIYKENYSKPKYAYIYNYITKSKILDDIMPDKYTSISLTSDNNYYYLNYNYSFVRIFDKKFKEILGTNLYLSTSMIALTTNGTISLVDFELDEDSSNFAYKNYFNTYDAKGNLIKKSLEYKRIIVMDKDYALVITEENNIELINILEEKTIVVFDAWKEEYNMIDATFGLGDNDYILYFKIQDTNLQGTTTQKCGYEYTYNFKNASISKKNIDIYDY